MFGRKKKQQGEDAAATATPAVSVEGKKGGSEKENPFLAHGRNQDDRYMNLAKAKHNWQVAWTMQTILLGISMAFNGYVMLRPKFQPYVVLQDHIGHIISVGPADQSNPIDSKRIIRAQTIEWVENSRAVIGDLKAAKRNIDWVYSRVAMGSAAKAKLDEFYRKREPYKTAAVSTASAVVTLALPTGGNTYECEWTEEWRNLQGEVMRRERWKVKVTYSISPQDKDDAIRANPAGYFVTDFSWSQLSGV